MKVVKDNHAVPAFKYETECSHCRSKLIIDRKEDFATKAVEEGPIWDPYTVHRVSFECPLCKTVTVLTEEQEKSLPASLVRWVKR